MPRCGYLSIEPMRPADLPEVAGIEVQSFATPWPMSAYEHELVSNPNAAYFVARCRSESVAGPSSKPVENVLVGYGGLWTLVDEAHVSTIAVHPSWRGRRIGEALLVRLIDYSIRRGMSFVTLEVRRSNAVAQRLYWKYGFVETGVRRGYYPDNREDALVMSTPQLDDEAWRPLYDGRRSELMRMVAWQAS